MRLCYEFFFFHLFFVFLLILFCFYFAREDEEKKGWTHRRFLLSLSRYGKSFLRPFSSFNLRDNVALSCWVICKDCLFYENLMRLLNLKHTENSKKIAGKEYAECKLNGFLTLYFRTSKQGKRRWSVDVGAVKGRLEIMKTINGRKGFQS